jgi:hypothetical protein
VNPPPAAARPRRGGAGAAIATTSLILVKITGPLTFPHYEVYHAFEGTIDSDNFTLGSRSEMVAIQPGAEEFYVVNLHRPTAGWMLTAIPVLCSNYYCIDTGQTWLGTGKRVLFTIAGLDTTAGCLTPT